jgi:hypothetical protein
MLFLDRRDTLSTLPRFALSPAGLLGELHDAQAALAVAQHYVSLWRTNNKPFSAYRFCATQEALKARNAIDRVVAMLRTEAAESPQHDDAKPEPAH